MLSRAVTSLAPGRAGTVSRVCRRLLTCNPRSVPPNLAAIIVGGSRFYPRAPRHLRFVFCVPLPTLPLHTYPIHQGAPSIYRIFRSLRTSGPNELPLFLEGDEELTALAEESAGAAQGLATQLSAVRGSHMSCWGIANSKSGDSGSGSGDAGTAAMVTDDDDEQKVGNGNGKIKGEGPTTISEGNAEGEEAVAAKEHGSCMGWWSGVLGRWHERTQLVDPGLQKKFKVVNQGPWAQITASLADRERANRRSFMTESEVRGIG